MSKELAQLITDEAEKHHVPPSSILRNAGLNYATFDGWRKGKWSASPDSEKKVRRLLNVGVIHQMIDVKKRQKKQRKPVSMGGFLRAIELIVNSNMLGDDKEFLIRLLLVK